MVIRAKSPPPIDEGWAWMISIGFFLYVFFMVGVAKSFGLIMVELIKEFQVSTAYAAVPITLCMITYAFGAPCAIIVAEHFTIQRVVIFGACFGLIGIAISSLMVSMLFFTIVFGVSYGIGNSCFYGNGVIMLGKYFRRRRSFANGLALSGASIGQFVLPPVIEYLLNYYGLRGTILIIAAFYFNGAITGCLFRPIENYATPDTTAVAVVTADNDSKVELASLQNGNTVKEDGDPSQYDKKEDNMHLIYKVKNRGAEKMDDMDGFEEDEDFESRKLSARMASTGSIFLVAGSIPDLTNSVEDSEKKSPKGNAKSLLHLFTRVLDFRVMANYVTLFYTIVSFLCFYGYFNFVLYLPSVVLEKGITSYHKALIISICGAGDLIARLAIGFFADLNFIARYRIKALACLLCALDIFMFVFADSFVWLSIHSFLYGFFGGSYVCMVAVVLVDFVGLTHMGKNLAVILFIQGIGSSVGQPFLGFLKDTTGSFTVVTICCALSLGLGAVILFCYPLVHKWESRRQKRLSEVVP